MVKKVVSSYRISLLAHNRSRFDSWLVLNSVDQKTTDLNIIITARILISVSFRCGVKTVKTVEIPQ